MTPSPTKSCPSCGERYDADVLFCPQDGTPLVNVKGPSLSSPEVDPYAGLELAGQIRIKHLIGIGSMGRVYRAFQAGIDRDVAVKILHRELSGNAELVGRFHREAKIASRLAHPGVVSVLMTGTIPQRGDPRTGGEMYLVMEYLDGMSLLSALAAAGTGGEPSALPLPRAMHIALQICDAVGEAHAQGIVHRDLKPENVMLVRRGDDPDFVKVLDFGIARLDWADRGGSMATQAGLIFGTAKYISPEGAEGKPVSPAADVYSIATILYQCLAGRTPFEGESPVQLLIQHTHDAPPDLRSIPRASYVPAPLAAVIMQNLAKKPEARAEDARALGKDLYAAARQSGLDPDELTRSSLLFARQGAVKLPSKERTKSLELSTDLASKIGGVPARPDATPLPISSRIEGDPESSPAPFVPPPPTSSVGRAVSSSAILDDEDETTAAPPSIQRDTRIDEDDESETQDLDAHASPAAPFARESTMQGTETPLSLPPPADTKRRARLTRIVAIVLCLAAAPLVIVMGGRRLGLVGATSADSLDGRLEAAREAMKRQAWDAPPGDNVKEILETAHARWPGDARVKELRREAAERLVTSALGRKYAGDPAEALHLARIAVSLNPSLTTAQHLVAELESKAPADLAPATSSAPRAVPTDHRPNGRFPAPRPTGKDGKPLPSASAATPPGPTATPTPTSTTKGPAGASTGPDGPVLPPTPPPLPTTDPAPTPTGGPWL
ncbi:serine/threonine protein kinase [Polyangium jinanense]|uniref:serine/threonine-protein kinase n=1 Tax=Polyangium jinanense TaxID=2829994 RepID=UPI0023420963|nr:serine/threonine-protein kinase [Polyangium jinanense]MDC3954234.1 serine/threonine protein kinase [Polyangium jinanense]